MLHLAGGCRILAIHHIWYSVALCCDLLVWGVGACWILIRPPQHDALTKSRAGEIHFGILNPQILVTSKKVNLDVSEIITYFRFLPSKERTALGGGFKYFLFSPLLWEMTPFD